MSDIKEQTRGRWRSILGSYGFAEFLSGKHGPCPFCGGKDRFRFTDKDSDGCWICNQCGAGDGFSFLQRGTARSFREIAVELEGKEFKRMDAPKKKDPRKRLNALWGKGVDITAETATGIYLHNRGLIVPAQDVRHCPKCYEPDTKKKYSAMIALIRNVKGRPVSIHRTYLDGGTKADIEKPKKLMPGVDTVSGAAVRLFPMDKIIGVAEGIETALACAKSFSVNTWATISAGGMESFQAPKGVREVLIFGDNDKSFTGQKAAYTLANRLVREGLKVAVRLPEKVGDFAE